MYQFGYEYGQGRPKKTWPECVRADMRACSLDPQNTEAWKFGVGNSCHMQGHQQQLNELNIKSSQDLQPNKSSGKFL